MHCNIMECVKKRLISNYGSTVQEINNTTLTLYSGIPIAVKLLDDARLAISALLPFDLPYDYETLKVLMNQNTKSETFRYGLANIAENIQAYEISWICEYEDMINTIDSLRVEARNTIVELASRQRSAELCLN